MADIGTLALKMTANPSQFERGIQSAITAGERFGRSMTNVGANVTAAMDAIAANPIGAIIAALVKTVQTLRAVTVGVVDELVSLNTEGNAAAAAQSSLERKFSLTAEAAGGLALQSKALGLDLNEVGGAMTAFQVHLGQAAAGAGETSKTFDRLGLNAKELSKLGTADALKAIAAATSKLPPGLERTSALYAILGRRGAALIPIIQQGGDALDKWAEKSQRWGLTFSAADSAMIRASSIAQKEAEAAWSAIRGGFANSVAVLLAPLKQAWAEAKIWFVESIAPVLDYLHRHITAAGKVISDVIHSIKVGFADMVGPLETVKAQIAEAWEGLVKALDATGDWRDTLKQFGRLIGREVVLEIVGAIKVLTWLVEGTRIQVQIATDLYHVIADKVRPALDGLATAAGPFLFVLSAAKNFTAALWGDMRGLTDTTRGLGADIGYIGQVTGWLRDRWYEVRFGIVGVGLEIRNHIVNALHEAAAALELFVGMLSALPGKAGAVFRQAAKEMRLMQELIRHPLGGVPVPDMPEAKKEDAFHSQMEEAARLDLHGPTGDIRGSTRANDAIAASMRIGEGYEMKDKTAEAVKEVGRNITDAINASKRAMEEALRRINQTKTVVIP